MELKDLCGDRIFTGIDISSSPNEWGDICVVVIFELDGVPYIVQEDPDDGYRSYCSELFVSGTRPAIKFPGVPVRCEMKPNDRHEIHNILRLTDKETDQIVLEVGEGNCDDYYPYWHFEYHPENMVINQKYLAY